MTHFLLSLMLVSFCALSQASASSEEELAACILKVPYGTSFRQPTKEDLAALPTEKIDTPPASLLLVRWPHSHVKVVYEPTKEPLTLQKMCEGLRAGHVFTIGYALLTHCIIAFIPKGMTNQGAPLENCFEVSTDAQFLESCFYIPGSTIFDGARTFKEWSPALRNHRHLF